MKRAITSALLCGFLATPLCAQDIPLSKILVEKEGWRSALDAPANVTYLAGIADGSITVFKDKLLGSIGPNGSFVADTKPKGNSVGGYKYACGARVYAIQNGQVHVSFLDGFRPSEIKRLKDPTCIILWPDEGHLVIGESDGAYLWAVRLEKDGSFGPGDRYYRLQTKPGVKMHVTAMTMDAGYLLYACTPLGIQVFDPTGRLSGVIAAPSKEPMTAITIGGEKADTLFIAAGDKILARKIQGKAPYTLKKAK